MVLPASAGLFRQVTIHQQSPDIVVGEAFPALVDCQRALAQRQRRDAIVLISPALQRLMSARSTASVPAPMSFIVLVSEYITWFVSQRIVTGIPWRRAIISAMCVTGQASASI